jgi:hypothetical protein
MIVSAGQLTECEPIGFGDSLRDKRRAAGPIMEGHCVSGDDVCT